VSKFLEFYKLQ